MGEITDAIETVVSRGDLDAVARKGAIASIRSEALADKLEFEGVPLAKWQPDDSKEITKGGDAVEFASGQDHRRDAVPVSSTPAPAGR